MLVNIINTVLNYVWYEIWQELDGTEATYKAFRFDGELGTARTVAVEWKECHAERAIKSDMARLGIA